MMAAEGIRRGPVGRYIDVARATVPGDLPGEGIRSRGIEIVHASAPEMDSHYAAQGRRQRVAVNMRIDVLESEHARGRIGVAAYEAGRAYQAVLERLAGVKIGAEFSGVRHAPSPDWQMIGALTSAKAVDDLMTKTHRIIGIWGGKILRHALGDRMGFREIAVLLASEIVYIGCKPGHIDKHAIGRVADNFRGSLEALGRDWKWKEHAQ
jgi:hypothetical protein